MTTQDKEAAVRAAATELLTAINDAKAAGLHVRWPSFPGGLAIIAISETGSVAQGAAVIGSEHFPKFEIHGSGTQAQLATPAASPVADALAAKAADPAPANPTNAAAPAA